MRLRIVLPAAACLLGSLCVPATVEAHDGSRVDITRFDGRGLLDQPPARF